MSAFIVSHDHIDAIVTYAVQNRMSFWNPEAKKRIDITRANAEEIGRMLLHENERSVRYRYSETEPDELPGTIGENAASYSYRPFFETALTPGGQRRAILGGLTAVQVIKAISCLNYQSCEHPGWEASLAWRICDAIKSAAINRLPGYDDAGWEINREEAARA
jgi:hypothetical protein